jgi:hypothetical protein
MSYIPGIAAKHLYPDISVALSASLGLFANPKYFQGLDILSIPQIITLIKLKAVTEESKLAEAARDA